MVGPTEVWRGPPGLAVALVAPGPGVGAHLGMVGAGAGGHLLALVLLGAEALVVGGAVAGVVEEAVAPVVVALALPVVRPEAALPVVLADRLAVRRRVDVLDVRDLLLVALLADLAVGDVARWPRGWRGGGGHGRRGGRCRGGRWCCG